MTEIRHLKATVQSDTTNNLHTHNGVLITHSDLMAARARAKRERPNSLYIKPLVVDVHNIHGRSENTSESPQMEHPRTSLNYDKRPGDNPDSSSSIKRQLYGTAARSLNKLHASGSPSLFKNNQSQFKRAAHSRQSLGGASDPSYWFGENDSDVWNPYADQTESPNPWHEHHLVSTIRVSMLPSLDDLGYALDSFTDPQTGHFIGLRICERFRNSQLRRPREHCLLNVGDVIVMVNRHKLAKMHESQAIRYVYNAFRDARQYTVEFGISHPPDYPPNSPPALSEVRTLPDLHSNRRTQPSLEGSDSLPTHHPLTKNEKGGHFYGPTSPCIKIDSPSKTFTSRQSISKTSPGSSDPNESSNNSPLVNHQRSFSTHSLRNLNLSNTRTIGHRIPVVLVKLVDGGLGFTLTSRDTHTGDPSTIKPVYVKKILPTGAAIAGGRLLIGDRLLSVNDVDVESLDQVSSQLRCISPGNSVSLVVSRQTPMLVDQTNLSKTASGVQTMPSLPPRPFNSFTFEFPLPKKSIETDQVPSLGVNFKWDLKPINVEEGNYSDSVGLYVDSLLPDGILAAVGRETLLPGDRLVGVNGEKLDGLNARTIISRVKLILNNEEDAASPQPRSTPRTFNLTVHRYHTHPSPDENGAVVSPHGNLPPRRETHDSQTDRSSLIGELRSPLRVNDSRRARKSSDSCPPNPRLDQNMYEEDEVYGKYTSNRHYLSVPRRLRPQSHFDREGFGRRSVSEKRHGHIDPIQFEIFQRNILSKRGEIPWDGDKRYASMPTARRLKMYKDRAFLPIDGPIKALHPANNVSDGPGESEVNTRVRDDEDPPPIQPRFQRGTKQNNSFRSAVDRSLSLDDPEPSSNNSILAFPISPSPIPNMIDTLPSNPLVLPSSKRNAPPTVVYTPSRFNNYLSTTSDYSTQMPAIRVNGETGRLPKLSGAYPSNSFTPTNSLRKRFGSLKGLFKRSVRPSPSDISDSTASQPKPSTSVPINRRLSVPDYPVPNARQRQAPPTDIPTPKPTFRQTANEVIPPKSKDNRTLRSSRSPPRVLSNGGLQIEQNASPTPPPVPPRLHISHERHTPTYLTEQQFNSYHRPQRKPTEQKPTYHKPSSESAPIKSFNPGRSVPTQQKPSSSSVPIRSPNSGRSVPIEQKVTTHKPSSESARMRSPNSARSVPSRDHSPVYIPKKHTTKSNNWMYTATSPNNVAHSDVYTLQKPVAKHEEPRYMKLGSDHRNYHSTRTERSDRANSVKSKHLQSVDLIGSNVAPKNSPRPSSMNPQTPSGRTKPQSRHPFSPSPPRSRHIDHPIRPEASRHSMKPSKSRPSPKLYRS